MEVQDLAESLAVRDFTPCFTDKRSSLASRSILRGTWERRLEVVEPNGGVPRKKFSTATHTGALTVKANEKA